MFSVMEEECGSQFSCQNVVKTLKGKKSCVINTTIYCINFSQKLHYPSLKAVKYQGPYVVEKLIKSVVYHYEIWQIDLWVY